MKQFRDNALSFFSLAKVAFPTAQLFISNILPSQNNRGRANIIALIPQYNSTLRMVADELGIWYLNTHGRFISDGNMMCKHFAQDKLHLNADTGSGRIAAGFQSVFSGALEKY